MLLGINALNHDASVCLVDGADIKFAAHAERYTRKKNDPNLNHALLDDCYNYGVPKEIVWFEKPWSKAARRIFSGERPIWQSPKKYLQTLDLDLPITYVPHHAAHAAMGFYTSQFDNAAIIVVDAIGEWTTCSTWIADHTGIICNSRRYYPQSMGLFYSAATQAIGLKPNEEEYILMGMAAFGQPRHAKYIREQFFDAWDPPYFKLRYNLHRGMRHLLDKPGIRDEDFAASVQHIFEEYIMSEAYQLTKTQPNRNLIIVGGAALNCVANSLIIDKDWYDQIWVPPNPGDAGLSLGAIAYHTKQQINFEHAYLGHNINSHFDIRQAVENLIEGRVIGIANGRAEWGPRALGNRSILADPRGPNVKDQVNEIKHREPFRPFAPAILAEHANDYFVLDNSNHEYMQFTALCKFGEIFPAIVHIDGTSRVQTVPKNSPSILRKILELWYEETGCPMLLNTSMNIKGEPLVNNIADAIKFSLQNKIPVF
jgi:carbamoyltransferase